MEKLRRVVQGRLGEIFGEIAVQADKFSRVIGFYRTAKESWENMSAEDK
jgi:acyl-homoserine lactone acylase PvdQ